MPPTLANSGVLPAALVIPIAAITMCIVAASIVATSKHTTPASRRRVRLANGWVMLLTIPLAATGFALIDSDTQPRLFVKVWILVIGLLCICIVLAFLDMLNTARLARHSHDRLRRSIHQLSAEHTETIQSRLQQQHESNPHE